jgi:hypothetical protein
VGELDVEASARLHDSQRLVEGSLLRVVGRVLRFVGAGEMDQTPTS